MTAADLSAHVRRARIELNLSREDLARKTGLTYRTVSAIENGEVGVAARKAFAGDTLASLEGALGWDAGQASRLFAAPDCEGDGWEPNVEALLSATLAEEPQRFAALLDRATPRTYVDYCAVLAALRADAAVRVAHSHMSERATEAYRRFAGSHAQGYRHGSHEGGA